VGSFAGIVMFFEGWVDYVGGLGFYMGWRHADLMTFMFIFSLLMLCYFIFCKKNIFLIFRLLAPDRYSFG